MAFGSRRQTHDSWLKLPSRKEALILDLLADGREWYGLELVSGSGGRLKRGTVYVTLDRMEEKGYVESRLEAPTGAAGLPRRLYRPTLLGRRLLDALNLARQSLVAAVTR